MRTPGLFISPGLGRKQERGFLYTNLEVKQSASIQSDHMQVMRSGANEESTSSPQESATTSTANTSGCHQCFLTISQAFDEIRNDMGTSTEQKQKRHHRGSQRLEEKARSIHHVVTRCNTTCEENSAAREIEWGRLSCMTIYTIQSSSRRRHHEE